MGKTLRLVGILVAVVLALLGCSVFLVMTTFPYSGDKAIPRMSESERALLATLQTIAPGTSYDELVGILGEPDREALGLRPTWRVAGSPLNQVAVYMSDGAVRKIRWLKVGVFLWEQSFPRGCTKHEGRAPGEQPAVPPTPAQ